MKLLIVTFSLRNSQRDYSQFFVSLRGNVVQWWHFIEQTCVVLTNHSVQTLTDALLPYLESTDSLLIAEIRPHEVQGWLPPSAWNWLNGVAEALEPTTPRIPPLPPLRRIGN